MGIWKYRSISHVAPILMFVEQVIVKAIVQMHAQSKKLRITHDQQSKVIIKALNYNYKVQKQSTIWLWGGGQSYEYTNILAN